MIISLSKYEKTIRDNFLNAKQYLQEKDYPYLETNTLVGLHYGSVREIIKNSIPENSILISVPSSSCKNALTSHFGNFITKDIKGSTYIDSNPFFYSTSISPAKNKLNFIDRVKDPLFFNPESVKSLNLLKEIIESKPIFIIEDWFATGESSINFKKELEKHDFNVGGIAALIVSSKYLCKNNDINFLKSKLKSFPIDDTRLTKSLIANFSDYSQTKITRFIHNLASNPQIKDYVNAILEMEKKYLNHGLITQEKINEKYKDFQKDMKLSL